jgi:hypothetical protein
LHPELPQHSWKTLKGRITMKQFTLYGIENEKFQRLEKLLVTVMQSMPVAYKLQKIHDIDIIVRSGIETIPSLFLENILITGDNIPDESEFKYRITDALVETESMPQTKSSRQQD